MRERNVDWKNLRELDVDFLFYCLQCEL